MEMAEISQSFRAKKKTFLAKAAMENITNLEL